MSASTTIPTSRFAWRVVDIVVASVVGVASGLLFVVWNIASVPVTDPLKALLPGLQALGGGFWLFAGPLTALIVRKPGAALFGELIAAGTRREDIVVVADIVCSSKIIDYVGVNSFDSLHGRAIPTAVGVKLANPQLTVVVHIGDGGAYAEGLEHLLGRPREVPALEAGVVVDAHAREHRHLLAAQPGDAAVGAPRRQARPLGGEPLPPGRQEVPNLLSVLHAFHATGAASGQTGTSTTGIGASFRARARQPINAMSIVPWRAIHCVDRGAPPRSTQCRSRWGVQFIALIGGRGDGEAGPGAG